MSMEDSINKKWLEAGSRVSSHSASLLWSWSSTIYSSYCPPTLSVISITEWRWLAGCVCGNWPGLVLEGTCIEWTSDVPFVRHALRFIQPMCHMCYQSAPAGRVCLLKYKSQRSITIGAQQLRCWDLFPSYSVTVILGRLKISACQKLFRVCLITLFFGKFPVINIFNSFFSASFDLLFGVMRENNWCREM